MLGGNKNDRGLRISQLEAARESSVLSVVIGIMVHQSPRYIAARAVASAAESTNHVVSFPENFSGADADTSRIDGATPWVVSLPFFNVSEAVILTTIDQSHR